MTRRKQPQVSTVVLPDLQFPVTVPNTKYFLRADAVDMLPCFPGFNGFLIGRIV